MKSTDTLALKNHAVLNIFFCKKGLAELHRLPLYSNIVPLQVMKAYFHSLVQKKCLQVDPDLSYLDKCDWNFETNNEKGGYQEILMVDLLFLKFFQYMPQITVYCTYLNNNVRGSSISRIQNTSKYDDGTDLNTAMLIDDDSSEKRTKSSVIY